VGTLVVADHDGSVAAQMRLSFDAMRAAGTRTAPAPAGTPLTMPLGEFDGAAMPDDPPVYITVVRVPLSADLQQEQARVQSGEILGLVEIPVELLQATPPAGVDISVLVPTASPAKTTAMLGRVAREATVTARVAAAGGDLAAVRALLSSPTAATARVSNQGQRSAERLEIRVILPAAFMFLMWIASFSSANHLLTSTIEEKSSKVIEVLLSATSPLELLAGKILGQSLVGLLMLGMYGIAGLAGLTLLAMTDLVDVFTILLFVAWFLLGYFMSAAMMAAVGSAVSDLREAQTLVSPVMLLMMLPLMLWLPISENPTGIIATVASFIPPIGPFVMVLRTTGAVEGIPSWQVAVALLINAAGAIGLVWLGARIFRIGILMQGKPPTPLELLRWARAR
jgi:ABC-2 type transport system permease protein